MAKKIIDGQKVDVKIKKRYPEIEFDRLQMYFGMPYTINLPSAEGSITISVPTMRILIELGEKRFLQTINIFTTNTTEYRLVLWDAGVDWNEISDFELFCMLYKQIDSEVSKQIFKDINFDDFELFKKTEGENEVIVLYNEKLNIEINEEVYQHIAQYLRIIFRIDPQEKITKDKFLKDMYIQKDRREAIRRKKKTEEEGNNASIQPLISACVNHPGFKYKLNEVLDMGIYEFYDSVGRLNVYESTTAVLKGMYSGMVDSKAFKPEDFNFMKEL